MIHMGHNSRRMSRAFNPEGESIQYIRHATFDERVFPGYGIPSKQPQAYEQSDDLVDNTKDQTSGTDEELLVCFDDSEEDEQEQVCPHSAL